MAVAERGLSSVLCLLWPGVVLFLCVAVACKTPLSALSSFVMALGGPLSLSRALLCVPVALA
eukprot:9840980-Prorocentrum_lima.AAC.1